MKQLAIVALLVVSAAATALAQGSDYKVVFDLTNPDPAQQERVMRWVSLISKDYPEAQMEIVMYGKGFELVMPEKSAVSDDVTKALENPNVKFRVCAQAMAHHNITLDMFFKGVQSVPDGIYELVQKQHEGWGYIKVVQ